MGLYGLAVKKSQDPVLATCGPAFETMDATGTDLYGSDCDSWRVEGVRFRLTDVDAPEIGNPECDAEMERAHDAKA
ncbi:MAG: hypothetical protein AAFY34_14580 [Pseudomonadota bacterium]